MLNLPAEDTDKYSKRKFFEAKCSKPGRLETSQMNHSIYSADRATHLKVVVVALVAGIVVAGLGISARLSSDDGYAQTAGVIKAGKPVTVTSANAPAVR